jgi:hypothetical protein
VGCKDVSEFVEGHTVSELIHRMGLDDSFHPASDRAF